MTAESYWLILHPSVVIAMRMLPPAPGLPPSFDF
jgi:hypothetical protein